jgi:hypothetical protein
VKLVGGSIGVLLKGGMKLGVKFEGGVLLVGGMIGGGTMGGGTRGVLLVGAL